MNHLYDIEVTAESYAIYVTDEKGSIDLEKQKPVSGTYDDTDPMGLFWSMNMTNMKYPHPESLLEIAQVPSTKITFSAEVNGMVLATNTFERLYKSPNINIHLLNEDHVYGLFYYQKNTEPSPVILVLGGGEGGLAPARNFAATLASHGFSTLALSYFKFKDLPESLQEIPIEYFEKAIEWINKQHYVGVSNIGVFGRSKGAEIALLLGATFPQIKAVVASSPHPCVFQGVPGNPRSLPKDVSSWSYKGNALPYVKFKANEEQMNNYLKNGRLREMYIESIKDTEAVEKATIQVEKTNGPIMIIGGEDDAYGPQFQYHDMIESKIKTNNFQYTFESLKYENAGHLIGLPYVPATQSFFNGGTPKNNAYASVDSWNKVLNFFQHHLTE
jgi:dienelactone hydrolase